MRVELDEDATRAAEKGAGQLGMSVNAFVNWAMVSLREVTITESATVTIAPQPPAENAPPKIMRRRTSWVVKF